MRGYVSVYRRRTTTANQIIFLHFQSAQIPLLWRTQSSRSIMSVEPPRFMCRLEIKANDPNHTPLEFGPIYTIEVLIYRGVMIWSVYHLLGDDPVI